MSQQSSIDDSKRDLRKQLRKRLSDQSEKDVRSQHLFALLQNVEEFKKAQTILFYVDVRDEVRTQAAIQAELAKSRKVVVPYCQDGQLKLVELRDMNELAIGAYGILEPNDKLKQQADRFVAPPQIDVALVPGLGFDRYGARIGQGKGYYDRLIPEFADNCRRIGIAFACQVVDHIPTSKHDQLMDMIATEKEVVVCERD